MSAYKKRWFENSCLDTFPVAKSYNSLSWRGGMKEDATIIPKLVSVSPLLLSFSKIIYHKHKSDAAWAHYGQPSCNILPSPAPWPGPSSVVLATQHPRTGRGRLCAGGVCGGSCMMSSCGMEGANQTLRKLCHLLLSWSIQGYRSAVNWELQRGHFSPELCMCVCVWEKAKEKKKRGRQAGKCIVDMLMLLTVSRAIKMSWSSTSKTSAQGLRTPFFFRWRWPRSPQIWSLIWSLWRFEQLVRTLSSARIKG